MPKARSSRRLQGADDKKGRTYCRPSPVQKVGYSTHCSAKGWRRFFGLGLPLASPYGVGRQSPSRPRQCLVLRAGWQALSYAVYIYGIQPGPTPTRRLLSQWSGLERQARCECCAQICACLRPHQDGIRCKQPETRVPVKFSANPRKPSLTV